MMIYILGAIAGILAGALALYLCAKHQVLMAAPPSRPLLAALGIVSLLFSLVMLLQVMGAETAVFTWMIALMLLWTVAPVLIGWKKYKGQK